MAEDFKNKVVIVTGAGRGLGRSHAIEFAKRGARVVVNDLGAMMDVHLMGAVYVTSAAWPILIEKGWGRVVLTSSGSGIFGSFGQSNYAAAKMGLVGLMNVLKLEGQKRVYGPIVSRLVLSLV